MNVKNMTYLLVALAVGAVFWLGWKLTSRNAYESAEYTIIEQHGNIELREYPDLMLATTQMSQPDGNDGSFGRLFNYISGGNDEKTKVAMTTPVFMEAETDDADGQMGFVIPKNVAQAKIPQPSDSEVSVTRRQGGLFAVIRFSGTNNPASRLQQQTDLESWITTHDFRVVGHPEFAGYDPPWTPGILRRNEILIRVDRMPAE